MSQNLEFSATAGLALTAIACPVGSYTGTAADSVTQQAGTDRYLAAFATNLAAGAYRLDYALSGSPLGSEVYDVSGSGTFQPRSEAMGPDGIRSALGMAAADLDTQLDAIAAKTGTIGTGTATVSSPVTATGKINPIVIGDDYLSANSRAFTWTVAAPTGFVLATSTCTFGGLGLNADARTWNITGTVTDAGGGNWTLSFDMTKAISGTLTEGLYAWSVELASAAGVEHTVMRWKDEVRLVAKQT